MSNHASVKIYFDGSSKQLERVKDLIITEGKFSKNAIDFSYVKPMLPGISNKNIFELIDKKDKILNKYEKLDIRTVDNYITRYKTLFNYFLDNDFIYTNYFLTIKKKTIV